MCDEVKESKSCLECNRKDLAYSVQWFCGPLTAKNRDNPTISDIKDLSKVLENCPIKKYIDKKQ